MARLPRPNPQCLLPVVQALALPLYWLIGRHSIGLGPVAAIVFAMVAPFATHALVVGIGFIVSWQNRHDPSARHAPLASRHGRRRDWLIAYPREAAVSIRQFYWLMPFRAGFRVPAPIGQQRERPPLPPILLIHGYGCNRGLWLPAARWFSRRGYRVAAIDLVPMYGSIDLYAPRIAQAVAELKARTGAGEVALIGHSMGGLAARAYLRHCAHEKLDPGLAALITLGTPHRGTRLAHLGHGTNARQMHFDSDWLQALARHEASAGSLAAQPALRRRITTIGSLQDNIITRQSEQRLPGVRAIQVRRLGHMTLVSSTRILRLIDRLLVRGAAQSPSPLPPGVTAAAAAAPVHS